MSQRYAVGLDLGGTAIKYGICTEDGDIIYQSKQPTQATEPPEVILADLAAAANDAMEAAKSRGITVSAIGLGTPGSVDVESGFLKGGTPNFTQWKNVAIKAELEEKTQLPVWADNDANVMAYGEAKFGGGKGANNVVCITLGTGIGGGIIMDGDIFRGSNYAGSELGHMSVRYDGRQCRCGGIGCWEMYASATAMIEQYRNLKPESKVSSTITIFKNYAAGEMEAVQVVETEIRIVAVGLASIINIFNPEAIIIGGGVSEAGDWFIKRIADEAVPLAMDPAAVGVRIEGAKLGNKAGLLGAAAFALNRT